MSTYKALKSADAEIILDLEKGKAIFDYSLNKYCKSYNSNTSCLLSKSGKLDSKLIIVLLPIIQIFFAFFVLFITPVALRYPRWQYTYQKIMKWRYIHTYGIDIQTCIGKISETKKSFHVKNNIWFNYELDGDYKKKIKTISLLRHFEIFSIHGFLVQKQNGWDVVFNFENPPENGSIVLKSTRG